MRSDYPAGTQNKQDFMLCVNTTHTTYMKLSFFSNEAEAEKGRFAHTRMGYNYIVKEVSSSTSSVSGMVDLAITIQQIGIAPFYYPLAVALSCPDLPAPRKVNGVEELYDINESKTFVFAGIPATNTCLNSIAISLFSTQVYARRPVKFAQGSDGSAVKLSIPLPPAGGQEAIPTETSNIPSSANVSTTIETITPPPTSTPSTNVAPLAIVAASSENASTGQTALKAVDGSTLGFPVDSTKEWATVGGGAGSWLQLSWVQPQVLDRVVLYDRPNLNDRVTGAELTFSDNSKVTVGPLANNGTAVEVTFPQKTTTSMRFIVTSVSGVTSNVGLAEIQAWTAILLPPAGGPEALPAGPSSTPSSASGTTTPDEKTRAWGWLVSFLKSIVSK
jgi:F5/8 type C domain